MLRSTLINIILITCFTICSCIQDDTYNLPNISIASPDISDVNVITFKSVVSRYEQAVNNGNATAFIDEETDLYITGYVISSDKSGNFFEELVIQNKTDDSNPDHDPRLGLKIRINVSNLSDTYEFGRKIYVKLNGLSIGESSGVVTIGQGNTNQVEQIQAATYKTIIIKDTIVANISPKATKISELSVNDRNTLIQLENMQVNKHELGLTYAGELIDEFDGLRTLENCISGASIMLQSSTFSEFKSLPLPLGKGAIVGVFTRDYGDDYDVLKINHTEAIQFNIAERCDPVEVGCGLSVSYGLGNLFYEDFESQKNNKLIEGNGWINYMETGTEAWEAFSSISSNASLGRSARVRSASSGDISNKAWLITPAINLDTQDGETLRFKTSSSFADSSYLEVLYSSDWDGIPEHITTATWAVLSDAYIVKNTDGFAPWFNSGHIDLSCFSDTMHIAFKYTGSGQETFDGTYELDEVSIDYTP